MIWHLFSGFGSAPPRGGNTLSRLFAASLVTLFVVHGSSTLRAESVQGPETPARHLAQSLVGKLGVLHRPSQTPHCAAVCLSSSLIATPGHCVAHAADPRTNPITALKFSLIPHSENLNALSNREASSTYLAGLVSGGRKVSFRAPIEADRDWAVLRLRKAICDKGAVSFGRAQDVLADTSLEKSVWVARIHRQTKTHARHFTMRECPITPTSASTQLLKQARSDFALPDRLLFHDCDAGVIASGSPLISVFDEGPHMVGMHVGTYVRSKVLKDRGAITHRLSSRPIAHIAVKSSEFTRPVFDLVTIK